MGKTEGGKESPGVGLHPSRGPVVAECHQDAGEFVLGHAGPVERQMSVPNFKGRARQAVEKKAGAHTEISSTSAATGPEEIGIMVLVNVLESDVSFAVDGQDLDRGKPIDGESGQPGEHTVTAAGDVAAGTHFVAAATGHGYTMALVQIDIGFAQHLPRADAIAGSVAGQAAMIHQAQIED